VAPFSLFNLIGYHPATVFVYNTRFHGVSHKDRPDGSKKDTARNIEQTKEFVINMVTEEIAQKMNIASGVYPREVDEFQVCGLTPIPSDLVKPPRVKESPVNMECRLKQVLTIGEPDITGEVFIGEVLMVHVRDDVWADGKIDARVYNVIARMGWGRYTRTRDLFEIEHPDNLLPP
jgi:flavin reductase (DIM6/NTAB) family NADH-FMN oxidoreductase RutF